MLIHPKAATDGIKVDPAAPTFPWADLEGIISPDPGGGTAPTLTAFRGGAVRRFAFAAGDTADAVYHLPHDYATGTDMFIHVHWSHNGTAISGSAVFTLAYTYAKGHNQAIFPAEKSQAITYATVNIATTPRWVQRIDEVAISDATGSGNYLDRTLFEPDGLLLLNLVMTTLPTITGGTPNEVFILNVDLHYQTTSIGTKQKSPPFYT